MKKILALLAAVALLSVSCQKQETVITDEVTWVIDFVYPSTCDLASPAVTDVYKSIESQFEAFARETKTSFSEYVTNGNFSFGDGLAWNQYNAAVEKLKSLKTSMTAEIAAIPEGSPGAFIFNCLIDLKRHNSSYSYSEDLAQYSCTIEY